MAAARRLFKEGSCDEVRAVLASSSAADSDGGAYAQCIQAMTTPKNTLAALDKFWRATLPATLRERDGTTEKAYVTKDELYRIMKWCVRPWIRVHIEDRERDPPPPS